MFFFFAYCVHSQIKFPSNSRAIYTQQQRLRFSPNSVEILEPSPPFVYGLSYKKVLPPFLLSAPGCIKNYTLLHGININLIVIDILSSRENQNQTENTKRTVSEDATL